MYLEKIKGPLDLKKLTLLELRELAQEMRDCLIEKASAVGGHLGPNLGVVELTIALHRVFESPRDKFVFDVSHQSYCHKMLTGRADAFLRREQYNVVSGYSNPDESEHDFFKVGHTSTSVSLACGLAKARDRRGTSENIVAIIGDGSLSGGEAFEGLDYARELESNLIVIVNDNQMSIAENHGGVYDNLKLLRATNGNAECNYFKTLGFDYRFVSDGHNIETLCEVLEDIKDISHPIVIHVCTVKGKGYSIALDNKEDWHSRPPFNISDGSFRNHFSGENYDEIVYQFLAEKMRNDASIVTMVAAVPTCIGFNSERRKEFTEGKRQFVDVGIAEEHALSMAAGIAKNGGKPVFATHASFFQRAYDQIMEEVCVNNLPVTLLVRNASIWGMNDVSHLGIFDIPLLSNIPNLVYLAPTNKEEYLAMLEWSIEQNQYPVAIRIPRNGVKYAVGPVDADYSITNKNKVINRGSKVAIFALGDFFQIGEETHSLLNKNHQIQSTLINPRFISGLDEALLMSLLDDHELVITLEDGILSGGYGEKIARFYGIYTMKVKCYGLEKEFIDRYKADDVLKRERIKPELIVDDIMRILYGAF